MDNLSDFSMASGHFVKMAMDEYYSTQNWTGLVERAWSIVDDQMAGKYPFFHLISFLLQW